MSQNLKQQLKRIREYNGQVNPHTQKGDLGYLGVGVNPDQAWVVSNKEKLINQISNTVSDEPVRFSFDLIWQAVQVVMPGRLAYSVVRPMAVFVLIGAIVTSGWIASVSATADSLPGELGYGVKMATEKTQEIVLAVTGSGEEKAQMNLDFAKRRSNEAKQVVLTQNKQDAPKNIATAIKGLEKSIKSAGENLKEVAENNPEKAVELTKNINEQAKEINKNLEEVKVNLNDTKILAATPEANIVKPAVEEVKKIVDATALSAVETVVQKQIEGVLPVTQEVKDMVQDKIDSVKEKASVVSTTISASLPTVLPMPVFVPVVISSTTILTTTTLSASSTAEVKSAVEATVKTVAEAGQEIKKNLDSAQNLVDSNNLLGAIQKVKEATVVTESAEQKVEDTKKVLDDAVKSGTIATTPPIVVTPIIPVLVKPVVNTSTVVGTTTKL